VNLQILTGWVESLPGKEEGKGNNEGEGGERGKQTPKEDAPKEAAGKSEARRGLAQEKEARDELRESGSSMGPAAQDNGEAVARGGAGSLKKCPNCHQAYARPFYSTAGWAGRGWCKLCRQRYSRQVQEKRGTRAAQECKELGSQRPAFTPA
jgi:hypothetical protein